MQRKANTNGKPNKQQNPYQTNNQLTNNPTSKAQITDKIQPPIPTIKTTLKQPTTHQQSKQTNNTNKPTTTQSTLITKCPENHNQPRNKRVVNQTQ